MRIEAQVTSLELAKKLKELGVKQDSAWYWNKDGVLCLHGLQEDSRYTDEEVAAFTVAELGEKLPLIDQKYNMTYEVRACAVTRHLWNISYHGGSDNRILGNHVRMAETEANARAKMLIVVLEHGYITKADWLKHSPETP